MSQVVGRKGTAKKVLKQFLEQAVKAGHPTYEFYLEGDAAEADAFIKNLRVSLSRLRGRVRDQGTSPRYFKLRLLELEQVEVNKTRIKLGYDDGGLKVLDESFADMADLVGVTKKGNANA